ncbi:hypothetical protein BZA77DRAFT_390988 [Pyronema omphalodes]|nr:hypothetical protein BZA77DRAFT_390988 [Pyronema omphalodes]
MATNGQEQPKRPKSPARLIQNKPNFSELQASRPTFDEWKFTYSQTADPNWAIGDGANDDTWKQHETIHIDPHAADRTPLDNYRLLVSGIIPRPIGVISTQGTDGSRNLAPFSYLQIVNHDPPIFTVGFTMGLGSLKDTPRHILETKECVINMISESWVEAANYTSIDAPAGLSEWDLSGLTPADSNAVKPQRVAEAVFAVEGKLIHSHDWFSPSTGEKTGMLAIIEGVYFHVREDALNESKNAIDLAVLKPVGRLGGITYTRSREGYEILRPGYQADKEKSEFKARAGVDNGESPEEA